MMKFSKYSKNLFTKLVAEGYEPIRGLGGNMITDETPILGLVNFSGSMWYAVMIINESAMPYAVYEGEVKQKLDEYFEGLLDDYGKKNIVVLNVLVKSAGAEYYEFLDRDNFEFDRAVMNVYWEITLNDGSLKVAKNNPDKIGNLKTLVIDSVTLSDYESQPFFINSAYEEATAKRPQLEEKGGQTPYLTYFLIIINLMIGAVTLLGDDGVFWIAMAYGELFPLFVVQGEYYRLFSYMFLHANFMHLFNNCFSLYIFGSRVERFYGLPKTLVIYLASGILAGVVSVIFVPFPTIGASGAVFGLLGAMLALALKSKANIVGLNYPAIIILAGLSLGLGFMRPEINNHAHAGGFIAGFVLGMIFLKIVEWGKKADSVED